MTIEALKQEISTLPYSDRKKLMAHIISLQDTDSEEYKKKMGRKIDDKNPDNWLSLEELDKRLGINEQHAMDYRLLVDYEVSGFLERLDEDERRVVRDRFVDIQRNPRAYADGQKEDDSGRPYDIHIFGRFVIKYWEDHTDMHLKIVDIGWADES